MRKTQQWTEFPKYPVTAVTLVLAAVITGAWWLGVDISPLPANAHVQRGQLWRFATDALPHLDIIHFIFNAFWIWTFGTIIEASFGHLRTLAIFLFIALCSSAAEYAFMSGGVGLSGVGYGLFGLLWMLKLRDPRFSGAVDFRIALLFVGWFVLCIALTVAKILPVGNVAHGVGALCGLALGWSITQTRVHVFFCASFLITVTLGAALFGRPYINFSSTRGLDEAALGYAALERGDNPEAANWLSRAARLRPMEPIIWFDLGIAYQQLGRTREAIKAYKCAVDLAPQNADYRNAYQALNRQAGQ